MFALRDGVHYYAVFFVHPQPDEERRGGLPMFDIIGLIYREEDGSVMMKNRFTFYDDEGNIVNQEVTSYALKPEAVNHDFLAEAQRVAGQLGEQFGTEMTWVPVDGPAIKVVNALAKLPFCSVATGMTGHAPLAPGEQN